MEYIDIHSERNFNEFEELYAKLEKREIPDGTTVTVTGCIHRIREMSDFAFVILRTARRLFQCVYEPSKTDFELASIKEGDYVRLNGVLIVEERSKIGYDFSIRACEIPEFAANTKTQRALLGRRQNPPPCAATPHDDRAHRHSAQSRIHDTRAHNALPLRCG